jgi:hypothetical protein
MYLLLSGAHCANVMQRFPHLSHQMKRPAPAQNLLQNNSFPEQAVASLK